MKIDKIGKYILLALFLAFMPVSFIYEEKICGILFLLILMFFLKAKGAVKSFEFTKFKIDFYNLPDLGKLITNSFGWIR